MIIALVGLVILSASFYTSISQLMQTQKHVRTIVIKQQMISAENRLNTLLLQPSSYEIIPPSKVAVIKQSVLEQLNISIAGARCPSGVTFCGITVLQKENDHNEKVPYWNPLTATFSGVLAYNGDEVPIKDIVMDIKVPPEVVQLQKYMCSPDFPFMAGFQANGELVCRALPEPKECGFVGGYVKSVDSGLRVVCGNFAQIISCSDDEYISPPGPQWAGDSGWVESGCTPRIDPYANPELRPL